MAGGEAWLAESVTGTWQNGQASRSQTQVDTSHRGHVGPMLCWGTYKRLMVASHLGEEDIYRTQNQLFIPCFLP